MAIKINVPLPFAPDSGCEYHRIEQFAFNRSQKILEFAVGSYVNADHAAAGLQPVNLLPPVRIEGEEAEAVLTALFDECGPLAYSVVKGKNDTLAAGLDV